MNHPIDITKNEFIEVYFAGRWNVARYEGWEPITEHDLMQPAGGGPYTIFYNVTPFNVFTGKECPQWTMVHESRVRPWNGTKS